jgi:hypothetical protein
VPAIPRLRAVEVESQQERCNMKKCAVPSCTCEISTGREFCSDECRNGLPSSGLCHCPHKQCRGHAESKHKSQTMQT